MEEQTPHRRRIRTGVAIMAATALGLVVAVPATAQAQGAFRLVEDNPTCQDIQPDGEEWAEFKLDDPTDGPHTDGTLAVNLTLGEIGPGQVLDWTSNIGVDAVIVKGGPNANVYEYDPEETEDSSLHAPTNPENEQFFDISHVSFCYDADEQPPDDEEPPEENGDDEEEPEPEPEAEVAPVVVAQPSFTG